MSFKQDLIKIVEQGNLDEIAALAEESSSVPTVLMSRLFAAEARTRWRAADAMGRACEVIGRRDPSKVRHVLQRLVWALNDESGTTGWGVPQAIGEVIRSDVGLAREFAPLLVAYLEHEDVAVGTDVLVHGVIYALGRIGERWPEVVRDGIPAMRARLGDGDATTRGLAAWALGRAGARDARAQVEALSGDGAQAERYEGGELVRAEVGVMAREALAGLRG